MPCAASLTRALARVGGSQDAPDLALTLNKVQALRQGAPFWTRLSTGGPRKSSQRRERLTWDEICGEFQGRWVALSECRYDQQGKAVEAVLVDTDDVLADLCERVQDVESACDIVFCS